MKKISLHLWYDKEAKEAAAMYTSLFPHSRIEGVTTLEGTPSGTVDIVNIGLPGLDCTLLSAGPYFKFTPAISLMVRCESVDEVNLLWRVLSEGGSTLMELGPYPFSERYGWLTDRFGLSWQLMYTSGATIDQKITPSLLFTGAVAGKTEEAIMFYASLFANSHVDTDRIARYAPGEDPDQAGTVKYAPFSLFGHRFVAMDSAYPHKFTFNEAVSLMVHCDTQEEIDYFWDKLSAVPEAEQCGWLKDKYGISWQIVPVDMDEIMGGDSARRARVTQAFLKMKKFDVAELRRVAAEQS